MAPDNEPSSYVQGNCRELRCQSIAMISQQASLVTHIEDMQVSLVNPKLGACGGRIPQRSRVLGAVPMLIAC